MKKIHILLAVGLFILAGCGNKENQAEPTINKEPYAEQQFLMGTYVKIQIYDDGKEEVLDQAFAKIKDLADRITVNQAGSEIDEVNDQAGIKPVEVSEDIFELVEQAYAYSEQSKGGFDLTIGPITELWHIGFDDARKPEQYEIDDALKLVDYQDVELDKSQHTIFLPKKKMRLDLGAIAKGFITDRVIDVLHDNDVTTAIVDLGGNVFVLGNSPKSDDGNWTVGIQDPNKSRNTVVGTVKVTDKSLVTSGIYERNLTVDGKTYHHLFNGKTGYPFENEIAGVTIISDKSVDGDGLSTAVFSMGVADGMAYVESLSDIDAVFVTKNDEIYISSGIQDNFKLSQESNYKVKEIKGAN